jgi:hypothetical protein
VLVLEIVSGRRNIDFKLPEEKVYLIEWAWKLQEEGRLFDLVETKLREKSIEEEIRRVINIGLLCVQSTPSKRPTMSNVIAMLIGDKVVETATRGSEFSKEDFENLLVSVKASNNGLSTVNEDSPLLLGLPTTHIPTGLLQLGRVNMGR